MNIDDAKEIVKEYGKPCYCKSDYDSDEYAKAVGFLEGWKQRGQADAEVAKKASKEWTGMGGSREFYIAEEIKKLDGEKGE